MTPNPESAAEQNEPTSLSQTLPFTGGIFKFKFNWQHQAQSGI
jgi:hypothetical protein